jgi:hypothetical protein
MAESHDVSFRLRLLNSETFKKGLLGLREETRHLGNEVDKTDGHMRRWERVLGTNSSHLQRAIRYASGFAAGLASIGTAEDAVKTTNEFTDATGTLAEATRLSTANASRWLATAKTWDISSESLTASFNQNAKSVEAATKQYHTQSRSLGLLGTTQKDALKRNQLLERGAGTQAEAFRQLGLSQKDVQEGRSDFQGLLFKEADALEKLHGSTRRASIAQTLFGRGWAEIVPIIGQGSKAMKEQFGLADKYGVTLHEKGVKSADEFARAQREGKLATLGLQLTLGRLLIPALTALRVKLLGLVDNVRNGTGKWAKFRSEVSTTAAHLKRDGKAMLAALSPFGRWAIDHLETLVRVGAAFGVIGVGVKALRLGGKLTGASSALKAAGKATGVLAGERGSMTNPMYVVVLDQAPGKGVAGKAAGKVASTVRRGLPGLAVAGELAPPAAVLAAATLLTQHYTHGKAPAGGNRTSSLDGSKAHGPDGTAIYNARMKHHALGGLVNGQGFSDTVPGMLKPGEFIVRREAVQAIGAAALAHLNAGQRPDEDSRDIHTHVYLDGREIATAVTKQARKARALT